MPEPKPCCNISGACEAPHNAKGIANCIHCGKELVERDEKWYTWDADMTPEEPRPQKQSPNSDYCKQCHPKAIDPATVTEARYLSDDRDERRPNELVIFTGGNGDWYVGIASQGTGCIGRSVRLCTSGGASSRVPGLTLAIANAFRALVAAGEGHGVTLKV